MQERKAQPLLPRKALTMPKKINVRAVYKSGSLTPLRHVDLEEGEVVSLTIKVESNLSKEDFSKEEPAKMPTATAGVWTTQEDFERIRRAVNGPKLSTDEWLEKVRKRRDASQTSITAA